MTAQPFEGYPQPVQGQVAPQPPVPEPEAPKHVLYLGDQQFVCKNQFPNTLLIRYADDGLMFLNKMLTRLVPAEDHERMWDAYEAIEDDDERNKAVTDLLATYSDRPTGPPAR